MKRWWSIMVLALAACVASPEAAAPPGSINSTDALPEVTLNNYGPAPELTNENWLNTGGQTLRLADLRGKVVAIDMWTYG